MYNRSAHYPVAVPAVGSQRLVLDLFKAFVDIALWRKGPQDLPVSVLLLLLVAMLDTALALVLGSAVGPPDERRELRVAFELAVSLGWIWLLLALFRRPERFVQTATAIFGTSVLLMPLIFGLQALLSGVEVANVLTVPLRLGLLTVFVWYLLISANILRAALEVSLFVAILLNLLGMGCVYLISTRVLSLTPQAA